VKGLVVRNPWAWCIGQASVDPCAKMVENRSWSTAVRGDIAIITGRALDRAAFDHPMVRLTVDFWACGMPVSGVPPWEQRPGAVTSVADLYDICGYGPEFPEIDCGCGDPWAGGGLFHLQFRNVRVLPEPVPVRGWQGLRDLPGDVEAAVIAGLPGVRGECAGC